MESDNKLKRLNIKNWLCFYFDNIININDLDDIDKIYLMKKQMKMFDYDATYKTLDGANPLRIIFNGYIKKYDKTKSLALFLLKVLKEFLIELDILLC